MSDDALTTKLSGYSIKILLLVLAVILWIIFSRLTPNHDVAWFLEGINRWKSGARLYIDIRELNPPLIFYDTFFLTLGTAKYSFYVAGIAAATLLSSLWVSRHYGNFIGLGVFFSIAFAGLIEFGQREHLLLIFVVPYLLAKGGTKERVLIGLWAFLGVGLKPHYVLVVILPAVVEIWRLRLNAITAEKITLAIACALYPLITFLLYPSYFQEIVPWGAATYFATGISVPPIMLIQSVVILAAVLLADEERRPFAAAVLGALAVYYVQGRFWVYHFIAAAGLSMILCFWQRRLALWAILLASQTIQGPYRRWPHTPIPEGISRVVIMSIDVPDIYPTSLGCGVTNETPWGSLGWIAGPWNAVHDPSTPAAERQKALSILMTERSRVRRLVEEKDVQLLMSVEPVGKEFKYPFNYMKFLGPFPEFRFIRREGKFELWSKGELSPTTCTERF